MKKLNKIQKKNNWIEGGDFSFGITPIFDKTTENKSSRSVRRKSVLVHQVANKAEHGRKALMIHGLDILTNSIISPPVSYRTRRQSLAIRPIGQTSAKNISTIKSKAAFPKDELHNRSIACKTISEQKSEVIINQKKVSKGKTIESLKKEGIDNHPVVRTLRNARSTNFGQMELSRKHKPLQAKSSGLVKKPLKRLSKKDVGTPLKSPSNNRRLTRSAKKKVKIVADSPTFSNGNFRKTPILHSEQMQVSIRNLEASPYAHNSSKNNSNFNGKAKFCQIAPFTPKPEEPLKLIRQNMKKKIANHIIYSKELVDAKFILVKKIPHKLTEPVKMVLPSTPVSSSNLPPTPVSSQKTSLRCVRKRDSLCSSVKKNLNDDVMDSSVLLEEPWSSTPVRNGADKAESPYLHSNLINISELTHHSRDTDISDSFSESITNNDNSDARVNELPPIEQAGSEKRSYCSIM